MAGKIVRFADGYQSVAVQAGTFNPKNLGYYVIDLLQKSKELRDSYLKCNDQIKADQKFIDQSEEKMDMVSNSVNSLSKNVDAVGVSILKTQAMIAHKKLTTDELKREIEDKKKRLEQLTAGYPGHVSRKLGHAVEELKNERETLERRLLKVNNDIEETYEDSYELEEKLLAIRSLRENQEEKETTRFNKLRQQWEEGKARKTKLLSVFDCDSKEMHMEDLYVHSKQLEEIRAEVQSLKKRQVLMEKQIAAQREERDYLVEVGKELALKVYNLEKEVRKEKGDAKWETPACVEPAWVQDLGGPTIWFTASTLSPQQVQALLDEHNRKFRSVQDDPVPGTSGSSEVHSDQIHIELNHKGSSPL